MADTRKRRWLWREVSPRRVFGRFFQGFGLVTTVGEVWTYFGGGRIGWSPTDDPSLVVAGVLMAVIGTALMWRVKPAPWP